jgi:DNA (cytosine-5)-methyltransferase 1
LQTLDNIREINSAYRPADYIVQSKPKINKFGFYEFFAGGGMARAGLGAKWECLFANDFDFKKSAAYINNWGDGVLKTEDVGKLKASELPAQPNLVWASFPCQDLSLAGAGAGLRGERSGAFWPFWNLIKKLKSEKRHPSLIVLENVCGTLTSHGGKDFTAIAEALAGSGYKLGAVVVDAAAFVPHSRPRLFIIAIKADVPFPKNLVSETPVGYWHSKALCAAYDRLKPSTKQAWLWWNMKLPEKRTSKFADLIEDKPSSVSWHTAEETTALLSMMNDVNLKKVEAAKKSKKLLVGTIYKRTRFNSQGIKEQRAEVRFDDIAGCLRTPAGGSSRQLIITVKGDVIKSRLISSRETARLMGLPDNYKLPQNYNEAYHLTGDGVVVPVVRHFAANLFEPILLNAGA